MRSDALGREQTTAPILLQGQPLADCDFNLAALHPTYPIKCRTSTQRTQAPESVDTRRASALDPLVNGIVLILAVITAAAEGRQILK
jgi:hypothetical protein